MLLDIFHKIVRSIDNEEVINARSINRGHETANLIEYRLKEWLEYFSNFTLDDFQIARLLMVFNYEQISCNNKNVCDVLGDYFKKINRELTDLVIINYDEPLCINSNNNVAVHYVNTNSLSSSIRCIKAVKIQENHI